MKYSSRNLYALSLVFLFSVFTNTGLAESLSEQLDDQMAKFLQSREKGMRINEKKNRVYLSSIFKWFKEDFESKGGVVKYISQYVSADEKKVLNNSKLKVSYMDYDWKINGR